MVLDKLITPVIVCFCYGSTQKSNKVYQIMQGRFLGVFILNLIFELMMLLCWCNKKRSFFGYFLRGGEVCMFLAPGVRLHKVCMFLAPGVHVCRTVIE